MFFFQAEDGIRDLVRSRGLGDVYKRQGIYFKDDDIQILHAGDSEIWLLRNDIFFKLTNDLSLIHI